MRSIIVAAAWLFGASLCACGTTDKLPSSVTITPAGSAGTVQVSGPTEFSAVLVNVSGDVTWTVSAGTVSPSTGLHVTYMPPAGEATATLNVSVERVQDSVQIVSAPPALTGKAIPGLTAPVTVKYDAQDVPHIQCAAAADCVAVQGYLQARDRLFPMDFIRHVARAHLAEMIGLAGLSQDVQLRAIFTTRDGKRLEDELVKVLDARTRSLVDAFTAGVNAYFAELKATPDVALGGEYRQLPFPLTASDLDPWTPEDTLAIGRLNQFQLSESLNAELANGVFALTYGPTGSHPDADRMAVWIRAASPTNERGHTLSASAVQAPTAAVPASVRGRARRVPAVNFANWAAPMRELSARLAAVHDRLRPLDASMGSNNWVVGASKSVTGMAMVANDPHLSLQYPPLFHLAAMTSSDPADNLNLTGGSFPGVPGALVGRGAHVGWGVTVVGYDVTDVYAEQFVATCPPTAPCVLFNSQTVPVLVVPQTYKIRVGPGRTGVVDGKTLGLPASSIPAVLIVPHHGPIVQPPVNGVGFSVRWTGHEPNTQDVRAFYGLATATGVESAKLALKDYATGAQNFVLADDAGHIAYDPHALVPVRPFAVAGTQLLPWFPLLGTGVAEWGPPGTDCAAPGGAPAACWIADDKLPQGTDPAKGYFFTANADPLGVSDDNDPLPASAAEPPYMSHDWSDSSGFRATRIQRMLDAAIAKNGNVSADDMAAIQSDHVSGLGMELTPIIAALPAVPGKPELAAAKAMLAQWATNGWDCPSGIVGTDPRGPADTTQLVVQNSSACFLFHVFLRTLVTNVFTDDLRVAGQGVNALAAVKAMLFMLDPANAGNPGLTAFCNDVDLGAKVVTAHSCPEQVTTALITAYDTLVAQLGSDTSKWVWGRVHTIKPVSLLALVTTDYSPGPFARPGGAFTVDVGNPSLTGGGLDFTYGSGGNVRHISLMDPAKPRTRMQLPGPERDGPTFNVGPNLLGQWVKNTYFDYAIGDQINPIAVATQSFKAP